MANHLAEKLAQERVARGPEKERLSRECAELITRLWKQRATLPDGTRPFESFEPMFWALSKLASDETRNPFLRERPKTKSSADIDALVTGAVDIDRAASALIRYFLAEAVAKVPTKDRRWAKMRGALNPPSWDVRVYIGLIDDQGRMNGEKRRLKESEVEEFESLAKNLAVFGDLTRHLKEFIDKRLKTAREELSALPESTDPMVVRMRTIAAAGE